jgi:hypothetical protein
MKAFRGAFLKGLQRLYRNDQLVLRGVNGHLFAPAAFEAWIQELETKTWILHAEPVTRGHESDQTPAEAAQQTLSYLARYANGVALSNERLIAIEGEDVVFSYKDRSDHNRKKTARVPGVKFLQLFLQHVLPQGLRHIRHYGFLAQNKRGKMLPQLVVSCWLVVVGKAGAVLTRRAFYVGQRDYSPPTTNYQPPTN